MINKKTLKSILTFTEQQHPAPSFIVIYILTWLAWHNQLLTNFISTQGDFFNKITAALTSLDDNQYVVVFLLTCLIFIVRLAFNYLRFRSRELLNNADDDFANAREDQKFAKDSDISNLMAVLEKTRQQLANSKAKEQKAVTEKNETIKKLLSLQHELEEARADLDILHKAQVN